MTSSMLVTYHYVFEPSAAPAGIRPLYLDEFELQLDWLAEHYRILHPDEFPERACDPAEPSCVLTFDDGTRDHLETIVPILESRNLSGVFFIITGPMTTGMMPVTHALHWALGHDVEEIWSFLNEFARERLDGPASLGTEADALAMYHYEDSRTRARVKYAVNVALTPTHARDAMTELFVRLGSSLTEPGRDWFLDRDEVRELHDRGMVIGNHGVTHGSLQALGVEAVITEMQAASRTLAEVTGRKPHWYTCPFGGAGASQADQRRMRDAMVAEGIQLTVTASKGMFDGDTDLLSIPRRDAAFLPPRVALVD